MEARQDGKDGPVARLQKLFDECMPLYEQRCLCGKVLSHGAEHLKAAGHHKHVQNLVDSWGVSPPHPATAAQTIEK